MERSCCNQFGGKVKIEFVDTHRPRLTPLLSEEKLPLGPPPDRARGGDRVGVVHATRLSTLMPLGLTTPFKAPADRLATSISRGDGSAMSRPRSKGARPRSDEPLLKQFRRVDGGLDYAPSQRDADEGPFQREFDAVAHRTPPSNHLLGFVKCHVMTRVDRLDCKVA
jgi:hypothetical protein